MADILKWVTDTLQATSMGPMALPLAFLLGLVSAVASACCTLPAMGMLVAYSGTRQDANRRAWVRLAHCQFGLLPLGSWPTAMTCV